LTHHIITQQQYSYLIAAVIGSAIVPTLIANAFFLPRHLLQKRCEAQPERPRPRARWRARLQIA
jgi:glutathione-regulated potassium-efflux system ancillary protein KefC